MQYIKTSNGILSLEEIWRGVKNPGPVSFRDWVEAEGLTEREWFELARRGMKGVTDESI